MECEGEGSKVAGAWKKSARESGKVNGVLRNGVLQRLCEA